MYYILQLRNIAKNNNHDIKILGSRSAMHNSGPSVCSRLHRHIFPQKINSYDLQDGIILDQTNQSPRNYIICQWRKILQYNNLRISHLRDLTHPVIWASWLLISYVMTVCWKAWSCLQKKKHKSSAWMVPCKEIHWWMKDLPYKGPVMCKMYTCEDIMSKVSIWGFLYVILINPSTTESMTFCFILFRYCYFNKNFSFQTPAHLIHWWVT